MTGPIWRFLRYAPSTAPPRRWTWQILLIAALHFSTLMALPASVLGIGSEWVTAPLLLGFPLEILRSLARRSLRREVRAVFLREAATHALDKRTLVPETDVESAFWAAQLIEYAMTVDVPALTASCLAAACACALLARVMNAEAMLLLLGLVIFVVGSSALANRMTIKGFEAVVERRRYAASLVAAAQRDAGEIYGDRARAPFLAQVTASVDAWSRAQDDLERQRLRHRLVLGALTLLAGFASLEILHIDLFHWRLDAMLAGHTAAGFLLAGACLPIVYVFIAHADSFLSARTTLKKLHHPGVAPRTSRSLSSRPSRLRASALSFAYPATTSEVFTGLSFDLDLTRILLITAANGSGKTTLANLICGLLPPASGSVQLDDTVCSEVSRDDIGFVPQNPLVLESLTVAQNVRLVAPDASNELIAHKLLELGLDLPLDRAAGTLSRGEQRRVAIARAILKKPQILVLDEPEVWLDERGRALLARTLAAQIDACAIIVIAHRTEWLPENVERLTLTSPHTDASDRATGSSNACGYSSSPNTATS